MVLSSEPMRAVRWSSDRRFIVARSDDQLVRVWDAATAEPVTSKLHQTNYVRFAGLLPNGRLLIASDPNNIQAWDFAGTRLAPDVLADYARLISGRRLHANGLLLPLKPEELAALRLTERPLLRITNSAGSATVTYPAKASNYVLEAATSLPAISWATDTNTPTITATNRSVQLPLTGPAKFFRLRKP